MTKIRMTEKFKETVSIQKWVIVLLFPTLVGLFLLGGNIIMASTQYKENIIMNTKRIEQYEMELKNGINNKVDKEDFRIQTDRIYNTLDRIEQKIDNINK